MYKLAAILLTVTLVAGCASTETVKQAKGEGDKKAFNYPYEVVYDAMLTAAEKEKLKVVEKDRVKGEIILTHGVTWGSWGERVAVFLYRVSESATEVEIISKPVMAPMNFPPDWVTKLFDGIQKELQTAK